MSLTASLMEPIRRAGLRGLPGLRPNYPPVAVEFDRREIVLVRVARKRGAPVLQAQHVRELPQPPGFVPLLRPHLGNLDETVRRLRQMLESTGTKPGRVSLVLPDNLAKVSILELPELPSSRAQLHEMVRFKLRKSVPFRMEEAGMTIQVLPGSTPGVSLLVALVLKAALEPYEKVLEAAGTRPGLVDLATPNLYNLVRHDLLRSASWGDVALLNCARSYFSLMILRGERLLFFRCKSYESPDGSGSPSSPEELSRELAASLAYHQEKLGGAGLGSVHLRSTGIEPAEVGQILRDLGVARVDTIDPFRFVEADPSVRTDEQLAQRLAPALGAAVGRGR
jgi:type IV pilus assembly protein PilM